MDEARQRTRKVAARYDLLRVIDRGGYAVVYEAEDTKLRRTVALKTVLPGHPDPAAGPRLLREARVMASITHPNVCGVSDVGTLEDGRSFFVMDRLEGETLRSLLNRELVVDPELAVEFCVELLSALHAVHACGTVHRDVKPENIFLAQRSGCRPAVKLLDFGCCGPMAARESEECLTRDFHVVGTAAYMAPEQAAGSRLFHAGTDVFAAALVLLESLTGFERQPPSPGCSELFPTLEELRPDLPPALGAVLARALSPDPRQRYRSTAAFAKDLLEVRPLLHTERPSLVARASACAPAPAPVKSVVTAPMFVRAREPASSAPRSRPAPAPAAAPAAKAPAVGARIGSYSHHLEDPTEDYRRPIKPAQAKDTIREVDDDTPHTPMAFPLDLRV